ncbi:MAG: terpene cyclase/mutase family protein [Chloroflexi bacterium]|nr:terpene cyclase/mutase family protein [Chloroflexota bacterium]
MLSAWQAHLPFDLLTALLAADDPALAFFARRDLLGEDAGAVERLWELPEPRALVQRQQADGSWRYPGGGELGTPGSNASLLETFRNLRVLVAQFGLTREHPAIPRAVDYVFRCQTPEGDIRGILSNQTIPYYHGALLELVIRSGYADDPRVAQGLRWLLAVRQDDRGWIVPVQAVPARLRAREMWSGPAIPPDRARPSSHLATGMALRAFAAHPWWRSCAEAHAAGAWLASRLFQPDSYNDRRAPSYWTKFQYPFWWTNLLTALDTLAALGWNAADAHVRRGLAWFADHQQPDGLWPTGYARGAKAQKSRCWVGLAVGRVLHAFAG